MEKEEQACASGFWLGWLVVLFTEDRNTRLETVYGKTFYSVLDYWV